MKIPETVYSAIIDQEKLNDQGLNIEHITFTTGYSISDLVHTFDI